MIEWKANQIELICKVEKFNYFASIWLFNKSISSSFIFIYFNNILTLFISCYIISLFKPYLSISLSLFSAILSLFLFLFFSLSLSFFFSLSISLPLSLPLSLFLSLCNSLFLYLSFSIYLFLTITSFSFLSNLVKCFSMIVLFHLFSSSYVFFFIDLTQCFRPQD